MYVYYAYGPDLGLDHEYGTGAIVTGDYCPWEIIKVDIQDIWNNVVNT